MRLKESRISITFIIIINSLFVGLFKFHIYKNLIGFIADFTISFRCGNRYEINNNLRFNDVLNNEREY